MNVPPLLENGIFITNVQAKANLLNEFHAKQCCNIQTESSLQQFHARRYLTIENVEVDRQKVLQVMRSLNSSKAQGWNSISLAMIKICDAAIVEPLCMIFEKSLAISQYPLMWKRANIISVHKKGNRQSKTTIAQFLCFLSLGNCLKNYCLIRCIITFVPMVLNLLNNQVFGLVNQQ